MKKLQTHYLEELIDQAYARIGDAPLSKKEEAKLINGCIKQVEQASYPLATTTPRPAAGRMKK
jgi:hypothetical protein